MSVHVLRDLLSVFPSITYLTVGKEESISVFFRVTTATMSKVIHEKKKLRNWGQKGKIRELSWRIFWGLTLKEKNYVSKSCKVVGKMFWHPAGQALNAVLSTYITFGLEEGKCVNMKRALTEVLVIVLFFFLSCNLWNVDFKSLGRTSCHSHDNTSNCLLYTSPSPRDA